MFINLKVKTLDAQTHEFNVDNELTVRELKDKIAEKTNISAEQQRIIYCGRVLADEKQLKEYDVDGKVVHVAERPPPSQRVSGSLNVSSGSNTTPAAERRSRSRTSTAGMRNSPLFRALDSMVVGTMTFPMNNNNNNNRQIRQNPFTASSSFCMNRITVARHMLQCADNIAAFLEDPSRGLNNTSLDILASGRWTMESTVVEVGISGEVPQNQNIVEMVQGAVNAALRRNGNTNVTVFQMPTNDPSENLPTTARVYIQNITEDEINTSANRSNTTSNNENPIGNGDYVNVNREQEANNSNNANHGNNGSRRRTGTNTLAEVIEQMRNVQNRLNPFIQQFYDFLQNEPTFEENDSEGRQNAQRLFDHVSEALHYMSHAQHAISDLMLDVSQPPPRYLTCRPILVDQSGYVTSNNVFTQGFIPPSLRQHLVNQQQHTAESAWNSNSNNESNNTTANTTAATASTSTLSTACTTNATTTTVEVMHDSTDSHRDSNGRNTINSSNTNSNIANNDNQQSQIQRLLQAIVNAAPINAEFNFSATTNADGTTSNTNSQPSTVNTPSTASGTTTSVSADSTSTSGTDNRAHVTTATLPTFSTQIRSTSRPQIANIPLNFNIPRGWNGNRSPNANNAPTFDRFLPCNSHHIRDSEVNNARNSGGEASGGNTANNSSNNNSNVSIRNVGNRTSPPNVVVTSHRSPNIVRRVFRSNSHIRTQPIPLCIIPSGCVQPGNRINVIPRRDVASNNSNDTASPATNRNQESRRHQRSTSATRIGVIPMHNLLTNTSISSTSTPIMRAASTNNGNNRPIPPGFVSGDLFGPIAAIFGPGPVYPMAPDDDSGTDSDTDNPANDDGNIEADDGDETASANSENENNSGASDAGIIAVNAGNVDNDNAQNTNNVAKNPDCIAKETAVQVTGDTLDVDIVSDPDINSTAMNVAADIDINTSGDSPVKSTQDDVAMRVTGKDIENEFSNTEQDPQTTIRNLYVQLSNFFNNHMFDGKPINDETIPPAINRAVQWFGSALLFLPQFEKPEYNSRDSLFNILRTTLPIVIDLIKTNENNMLEFEQKLRDICEKIRQRMYSVLYVCVGADNAQIYWRQLMRLLLVRLEKNFAGDAKRFLYIYLNPIIPVNMDEADAQQFIVQRNSTEGSEEVSSYMTFVSPTNFFSVQSLDSATAITDVEMSDTAGSSQPEVMNALPAIIPGSEPWHQHFPNDWLPIITRDVQKQSQSSGNQTPFSDVYISGMSSKRRKMIQNSKSPSNVNSLIADGINKAIQNVAFAPSTTSDQLQSAEEIASAIASDTNIQSTYTEALRSNLRERLKVDPDFKPENYPQTEKFLKK